MTIAIAKDEAFNFTYLANIDRLSKEAEIVFFSPLRDDAVPDCDKVYLPGGYPELYADELTGNASMRESIREFAESGGVIFAECGGFMYLCRDIDGKPMCGVFPFTATMHKAHLHLGYRTMNIGGKHWRGHEFHYSDIIEKGACSNVSIIRNQFSAKGERVNTAIYRYKNVVAGYTHWYWGETEGLLDELLDAI